MRLLLVTLGVLLALAVVYFSILIWGLSQPRPSFSSTLFDGEKPALILPYGSTAAREDRPFWFLKVFRSETEDIRVKMETQKPLLSEVLRSAKDARFLIEILDNKDGIHEQVAKVIGPDFKNRIMIQSEFYPVLVSLRDLRPELLYGSSQPDRLRMLAFDSMRLLPAMPFKGDAFVGPIHRNKIRILTPSVVSELRRRSKYLVIGPVNSPRQFDEALTFKPDGIIVLK